MPRLDEETLDMVLSSLKSYAEGALKPEYLLELDARDEFPVKVLQDLYDPEQIGLHLLFMPEEYGGFGGGAYDIYRVAETMAGIDLGVSTAVLATFLGTDPIIVGGTEDHKATWMGRIVEEGLLVAYRATEPQAGSDLSLIKTRAVPVHRDGELVGYKLTGRKQWISNGGVAALYTILADAPGGPSWFIVERGAEGFTHGKPEDKHGLRASNTAALFLDDVLVAPDRLVGGVEGRGLAQAQAVFGYTRLMVAAFGLGAGWAALRRAILYSQERVQGGSLLCQKQGYTHKLIVPNAVRLEAARSYIEWVAERIDDGDPGMAVEGAIAKYLATEAGNKAAEDSIQALGGYGYTKEYMVEKIKRDVRITTIYEGTSEILENVIARDRWQQHLKTRGLHYRDWAERLRQKDGPGSQSGLPAASRALALLGQIMERARLDRLTRNQHVLLRLGELVVFAETAALFSERMAGDPPLKGELKLDTLQAMARIHARDALQKVAWGGLRLLVGAGQRDPQLAGKMDLPATMSYQAGLLDDMDLVARKLMDAYPAA